MNTLDEQKLVLIVDDDIDLIQELSFFFNTHGLYNISANNIEDAKKIMLTNNISLLVADVVMPGGSGIELTKWVLKNKNIPIILLTSLDDIIDKVTGLEIGADDYVSKPFNARELLARIGAVLRRAARAEKITEIFDSSNAFSLNNLGVITSVSSDSYKLRSSDAKLLRVLVNNQGTPVSRQQLYNEVLEKSWNPDDRGIDNMVVRLRSILETDKTSPKIIRTVRQMGYLLTINAIRLV